MSKSCYVFDLDGTLADCRHRLHLIQRSPPDWRGFFAACGKDELIVPVARLYRDLRYSTAITEMGSNMVIVSGRSVVIVSGRSDECRWITEDWLERMNLSYDALYMRAAGDHTPDYVCKGKLLDRLLGDGWSPILMVDDRRQVVDMWRARGYTCLQCNEGDF